MTDAESPLLGEAVAEVVVRRSPIGPALIVLNVVFVCVIGYIWNAANARSIALLEKMAAECVAEKEKLPSASKASDHSEKHDEHE